jgi:threonine dehydrogenase-like Zn-dependent dehydrogenase
MSGIACTTTLTISTMSLPASQKAAVKVGKGETSRTEIKELPVPEPAPDQILVKVNYSGLCASDKSLLLDEWEGSGLVQQPCTQGIAGHEGAGTVVAVGRDGMTSPLSLQPSTAAANTRTPQCRISGRSATARG